MSDTDYDDEPQPEPEPKRNWRRELEAKAAEADQLRREVAIFKAGLTGLTERQVRLLASEVGDNLTPEAINAAAQELGWAKQPEPDSAPSQEEVAAFDRAASASNGASSPPPIDAEAALDQAWQEGGQDAFMAKAAELGLPTTWTQQ